ncbi:MAG: hypothetical protein F6K29_33485, partial [Okeania sp. SIO2G5]|nr:hypothetical protein [Okeania sp. SIO2G5]
MTLHSHLPLLPPDSTDEKSAIGSCPVPGSPDLTYIQDGEGCCHSFVWQSASLPGVDIEQLKGQGVEHCSILSATGGFQPIAIAPYLSRVRNVISTQIPALIQCPVRIGQQHFLFDLNISPILIPRGKATQVIVVGTHVRML